MSECRVKHKAIAMYLGRIRCLTRYTLSRAGYRADYRTLAYEYATLLTLKLTMTFWNVISQTAPL